MYKTILLPVEGVEQSAPCEKMALRIGRDFSSHIKGLRIVPTLQSLQAITEHHYLTYDVYEQILENQAEELRRDKEAFIRTLDQVPLEYEWIEEEGDFLSHLKAHARTADLAIVPQGSDELGDVMGDIPSFILDCGIPTLAVPKVAREDTFAENIFIAWNGGKESIRAVHGAMPLLKKAANVTVLSIAEEKKDEIVTADVCKYLAHHDVNVKGMTEGLHYDPGAKLMEICLENNADLIVAGAWAHTRLAELIYGGVTKTLFNNQEIPVLFAH
ncbi:universal stress protein [Pseudemcibacter aquimaris]|uniref:universal stress protein n=1 Tax=Pseudemcibacter aquimaris TaxID=2857064 RepID=UPI0020139E86|nr:universal stress protein [Pseudemcibacter aquimaris]MCC3859953.1 universal stress protein [Pseudemcibacter aquimaris]WDU57285.1 universal stress protein [Pseudemcibacter aquimaris]